MKYINKLDILEEDRKGFSLVEILVVLGIFSFFLGGGLFLNIDFFKSYYFRAEEKIILNLLQEARSRSLANVGKTSHGLFLGDEKFVLFYGESYEENSPTNEDFRRNKSIQVESALLNQTIVFENLSGIPNQVGEITIFDGVRESVIKIENEGKISS